MRVRWHQEAGPARLAVTASVPGAAWDRAGRESAVLRVLLDADYHQDIVLCRGDEEATYERLLGDLDAGDHSVEVAPHPDAPPRPTPDVAHVEAGPAHARDDEEAFVWRMAPWLFTRSEADPWESMWTDTPLLMFSRIDGATVEYQCLFSNEDGDTDTRGLLAQWGRTSDIEWVLRLDRGGGPATIQGRDHLTEVHRGTSLLGRLTLQTVGVHGMVSSEVPRGVMRCLFLPRYRWDPAQPRESIMDAHPWSYRLSSLEMAREGKLTPAAPADDPTPGDLRDYLYLQVLRSDLDGTPPAGIEVRALLADGRTFSSTHGEIGQACFRRHPFATTIKLPPGAEPVRLEAGAHPAPSAGAIRLQLHKAFRLDERFLPRPPTATGRAVTLERGSPAVTLWERGTGT